MAFAYSYFLIVDIKIVDTNRMMLQRYFADLPERNVRIARPPKSSPQIY
jgi:hypothetical protein